MILLRCLHPPGAATALAPIVVDQQLGDLSLYFVLVPVGLNSAILLILALIINRWVLNRDYPLASLSMAGSDRLVGIVYSNTLITALYNRTIYENSV